MKNTRASRLRVLPLMIACTGAGLALSFSFSALAPAPAQAQVGALPATVGVVDEDVLATDYKEYQNAISALDKRAQDLDEKIPAREYLDDKEGTLFDTLIVLPTLTPTQQTQLNGLIATGKAKKAELTNLVGNPNRTSKDEARRLELQALSTRNDPNLRKISQGLVDSLRTEQSKVDEFYTARANTVVTQVAAEKKMVAVMRKKALVWSADNIDITQEVLRRLNPKG